MWKRWSFKSLSPAGNSDKTQSPSAVGCPASNPATSTKPVASAEAPAVQTSPQSADPSAPSPQVTDENRVAGEPVTLGMSKDATIESPPKADGAANATDISGTSLQQQPSQAPPTIEVTGDASDIPDGAAAKPDSQKAEDPKNKAAPATTLHAPNQENESARSRHISFRSFAFFYGRDKEPTRSPSNTASAKVNQHPAPKPSRSEKQAMSSALVLRSIMLGSSPLPMDSLSRIPKARQPRSKYAHMPSFSDFKKAKTHLLKFTTANAVISQLRRLPLPDGPTVQSSADPSAQVLVTHPDAGGGPIHAVCLPVTDEEADAKFFSRLRSSGSDAQSPPPDTKAPDTKALVVKSSTGFGAASLESIVTVLKDLHLVSLLESPDLGFGQPVSDHDAGPLAGSVPSAGTVLYGFEEITKQLMALGFATSKAVFPSHAGVHPPEDRMSLITYWWGLELVLPEPSIQFLTKAKSISDGVLNFLSAIALVNNGVREVLPFIRYISNFVDFEWSAIQAQDNGRGVVCAATWVMPAAMVPRPWDFAPAPPPTPAAPKPAPSSATPSTPNPAPSTTPAAPNPAPSSATPADPAQSTTPAASNPAPSSATPADPAPSTTPAAPNPAPSSATPTDPAPSTTPAAPNPPPSSATPAAPNPAPSSATPAAPDRAPTATSPAPTPVPGDAPQNPEASPTIPSAPGATTPIPPALTITPATLPRGVTPLQQPETAT